MPKDFKRHNKYNSYDLSYTHHVRHKIRTGRVQRCVTIVTQSIVSLTYLEWCRPIGIQHKGIILIRRHDI